MPLIQKRRTVEIDPNQELQPPATACIPGRVRWFNPVKFYGFLETPAGDVFFHGSAFRGETSDIQPGDEVECELQDGPRGARAARAINVCPITAGEELS